MIYPTAEELLAMGATLTRDVDFWNDALDREYRTPTVRAMPIEQRREYDRSQRRNWAGRRKLGGGRIA